MAPVSVAQRQRNWHEKLKNEEKYDYKTERILLNCAPSSIHLHPAPPSSIHLHPAHFNLHPALCNTLNNIWTKILHVIGQFPQILTKNWHTWYFGGVDSESRLRFLKFRPQNPFLGKFGPKNSKLSVLSENWYTWYLKDADSYSNISFLNFKS